MTLRLLASKLAKLEGKKDESSIGNIREFLNLLVDLEAEERLIEQLQNRPMVYGGVLKCLDSEATRRTKKALKLRGKL